MESYRIFLDLAIIMVFSKFFGLLARKFKAPQVVGEIFNPDGRDWCYFVNVLSRSGNEFKRLVKDRY